MALSDLAVFNRFAYDEMTEVVAQQIDLFNAASQGTMQLVAAANLGDYNERAFWAKLSGLVRRRNAYGSGAVGSISLAHRRDVSVKVAAGTPPVRIDPGQFRWIQQNPEEAGIVIGRQLAGDMLADMVNIGLGVTNAALRQHTELFLDKSTDKLTFQFLADATVKLGDRANDIRAWAMHSIPMHNLYTLALANASQLFTYGTVNVMRDPVGRVFIITDSPNLVTVDTGPDPDTTTYHTLGLQSGAVVVEQNNDFDANIDTRNGDENIIRDYQAEWTYNVSVKGFAWDKGNGGHSPNDAALLTSTNWDKIVTSFKDCAGVVISTDNL